MACSNPTPPVGGRFGAPMGRHVRLNGGGYDDGGAYWGHGQPLFYVEDQDGNSAFLRASSREGAKAKIRADFPDARFYR